MKYESCLLTTFLVLACLEVLKNQNNRNMISRQFSFFVRHRSPVNTLLSKGVGPRLYAHVLRCPIKSQQSFEPFVFSDLVSER